MINIKPEDLNNLSPQAMIAYKFLSKVDRDDPINIAMAESIKEQARSEKIDNDRKVNPDIVAQKFAAVVNSLSLGIYKVGYPELDDDAKKHVDEMATKLI